MRSSGEDYFMCEMNAIRYLSFVYMIIFGFTNKHLLYFDNFLRILGGIIDEILHLGSFCGSKSGFSDPYFKVF